MTTNMKAVRALYEAARFSLAVFIDQGCHDTSEQIAVERLTKALVEVARCGVLQGEQRKEVSDGRVG